MSTSWLKPAILIFTLQTGYYEPASFKKYVESLHVVRGSDHDRMPTRQYEEWKHSCDGAKRELLDMGVLVKTERKRFTIPTQKMDKVLSMVSGYVEPVME